MKLLLIATQFTLPYRVLRCAAALGAKVWVMGPSAARSLVLSRQCAGYNSFDFTAHGDEDIAVEIDRFARECGAERVLCSDYASTLLLARIAPMLRTPSFPLSTPEALRQIGTKDNFMHYCREKEIAHPSGAIYSSGAELSLAIEEGRVRYPAILKPIDTAGGIGIVRIDENNAEEIARKIDYAPILAQDFIEGEDRSITLFCRDGVVQSHIAYSHPGDVFQFTQEPELLSAVESIAEDLRLNGVINFDARIDTHGKIWMIECNPRFFFNMDVAMIAGMNFADDRARRPVAVPPLKVRTPRALLSALLHLEMPTAADRRMLAHWLRDPVAFLAAMSGYQRRWHARWIEEIALAFRPIVRARPAITPAARPKCAIAA